MVAIYGQTDKFMLKQMLNESSVGFYSKAMTICAMWVFILNAIIDSIYPTIMQLYKKDYIQFVRKNRQLYAIVFYVSIAVSNVFLNLLLIPVWGASGAAIASLITQVCTSTILPFCFKDMRRNSILMLQAIALKNL